MQADWEGSVPGTVMDACCLINLFAAGDLVSLLTAIGGEFHVPEIVIGETLYVIEEDPGSEAGTTQRQIDLGPALTAGVLHRCRLENEDEKELFVGFAAEVDDGEAACLAIAKARGFRVATDDRKAQRLAGNSAITVVTTPELIKGWADAIGASDEQLRSVLRGIRRSACFLPRKGAVLYQWWMDKIGE